MMLAIIALVLAVISAIIIASDLKSNPQSMRIMNVVWVLTALWGSIFGLIAYFAFGREKRMAMPMGDMKEMDMSGSMSDKTSDKMDMPMKMPQRPQWQSVTLSTLHCGAGCTLADILGSMVLFVIPMSLGCGWVFTYILALVIGVYFQFVAIREMSSDSTSTLLKRAIKADFLSLTSWQIGMYGWLALLMFHLHTLPTTSTMSYDFWFAMQQAMIAGFVLALPMNYLLIRAGVKGGM